MQSRRDGVAVSAHDREPSAGWPVVLIHVAAGGYEALKKFFESVPRHPNMAFVVMPHVDQDGESQAEALIPAHIGGTIIEARRATRIKKNRAYVVPFGKSVTFDKGELLLGDLAPEQADSAVEAALESLATDRREMAVAVVLSGIGHQGLRGLRKIKARGGIAIAQSIAEQEEVPRQAVDADLADFVLPPERMWSVIASHARGEPVQSGARSSQNEELLSDHAYQVLALLKARKRYDFDIYKKSMIERRIRRRMEVRNIGDAASYVEYARHHVEELDSLYKDLLIGVTAFFREQGAFDVLAREIVPELLERVGNVRIWVPGCATGREAYSIAMLFAEQIEDASGGSFRIFATDIDSESLEVARHGIYPASIEEEVSPKRLERFFVKTDRHYRIVKQLRESVVFASQNLVSDPPFSNIDLISCRNLLIYLEPNVQNRVISVFHFALKPGGYLMLASAESLGSATHLFAPTSRRWRIYRRVPAVFRQDPSTPALTAAAALPLPLPEPQRLPTSGWSDLLRAMLSETFAPAAALVDLQYEVLAVQGPLVRYLEFPPGPMSSNLLILARHGLRARLALACRQAQQHGQPVHSADARVKRDGRYVSCSITVSPVVEPVNGKRVLLVLLQDITEPGRALARQESRFTCELEEELESTREELNRTIQELVRSTEELRASNEEVMSINEELQSANDEHETSKEELQALNEELSMVNAQLREKLDELDASISDMANLMTASEVATVFLDKDLKILRFTPSTGTLLSLRSSDVGRPFRDFAPKFRDDRLIADCVEVMTTGKSSEKEVWTEEHRWYLRRVSPYRSAAADSVEGIVITFFDISRRVAAETRARLLANVVLESRDAVIVQTLDGRIGAWNRGAELMYGYSEAEASQLGPEALVPEALRESAAEIAGLVARGEEVKPFDTQRCTSDGRVIDVSLTVTPLRDEQGSPIGFATVERDITTRRQVESEIRELNALLEEQVEQRTAELQCSEQRIRAILDSAVDAIVTIDARGTIETFNAATARMFSYVPSEIIGRNVRMLMPSPGRDEGRPRGRKRAAVIQLLGEARRMIRKDGSTFPVEVSVRAVADTDLFAVSIRDLSERESLQEEVVQIAVLEQQRIGQELHDSVQQELTGLSLLAGNLRDTSVRLGEDAFGALAERLSQGIDKVHQCLHLLAEGLVPLQISPAELASSLQALAYKTTRNYGIECGFTQRGRIAIETEASATHLFRIAQEAVTNSVKHARATRIAIALYQRGDVLELSVEDDGCGVCNGSAEAAESGLGLRIMRYRSASIGGQLRVERKDYGGTRMICLVPATTNLEGGINGSV